ncbi:hypothetical protein Pmani_013734 [Petrolisthes manimaculis]|uniref:Uncharacterized protein n=1 Tax=Petrolisthes manimaculis TaxID=1843537 RepID=A0AAE1PWP0_9EUCA|nr:hypothetical protein Pmani_013734 [Petrolisthes manimaculis]
MMENRESRRGEEKRENRESKRGEEEEITENGSLVASIHSQPSQSDSVTLTESHSVSQKTSEGGCAPLLSPSCTLDHRIPDTPNSSGRCTCLSYWNFSSHRASLKTCRCLGCVW